MENTEVSVDSMKFEQETSTIEIENSDKKYKSKIGLCGIFRYRSMEREILNYNEHRDTEGEEKFLKSLMIGFQYQIFDKEHKLELELRHTGNISKKIESLSWEEYQKGQLFFFEFPFDKLSEWK